MILYNVRCNGTLRLGTGIYQSALDYLADYLKGRTWVTLNDERPEALVSVLVTGIDRAEVWQVLAIQDA